MQTELISKTVAGTRGEVLFQCQFKNGENISTKTLSLDDYINLLRLSSYKNKKEKPLFIPTAFPKGYVAGTVLSDGFESLIFYPAEKRVMIYMEQILVVPFPNLLFYFRVKQGHVFQRLCFATKDNEIHSDTALYKYPFGNVSSEGRICFGNMQLPHADSMNILDEYIQLFFESKTNDDYYEKNKKVNIDYSQGRLLNTLTKKESFPERYLVECGKTARTLFIEPDKANF